MYLHGTTTTHGNKNMNSTNPSQKQIRDFGLLLGGVCLLVVFFSHRLVEQARMLLILLSGVFLVLSLIAPKSLSLAYHLWMKLAGIMQVITTTIILSVLFYVILTPLALIARLFGKRFLERDIDKNASTYWETVVRVDDARNQF